MKAKPAKKSALVAIEPVAINMETVQAITSLSRSTIEKLIREDKFPKARAASDGTSRWLTREIREWSEALPVANNLPPPNSSAGGKNSRSNA